MISPDKRTRNLFARLFTYVPLPVGILEDSRPLRRRNALEDFCTEALAWCFKRSKPFRENLYALPAFKGYDLSPRDLEIYTQLSFTGETEESDESEKLLRGRFDMVVRSNDALIVVECKVAPDTAVNINKQIGEYRRYITAGTLGSFRRNRIILLTPYADAHDADAHLSWSEVRDALCTAIADPQSGPDRVILQEFSEFLAIRSLTKMKLPPLNTMLPALKTAGPLIAGLEEIFESLRNDEVGRALFRRDAAVPKMDWHREDNKLWYGIWSRGSRPVYYIGFDTTASGADPLSMWVQVLLNGDRTTEIPPKSLAPWFNKSFSGLEEGGATAFVFAKEIRSPEDNAGAIEEWLRRRLRDVKEWADSIE